MCYVVIFCLRHNFCWVAKPVELITGIQDTISLVVTLWNCQILDTCMCTILLSPLVSFVLVFSISLFSFSIVSRCHVRNSVSFISVDLSKGRLIRARQCGNRKGGGLETQGLLHGGLSSLSGMLSAWAFTDLSLLADEWGLSLSLLCLVVDYFCVPELWASQNNPWNI